MRRWGLSPRLRRNYPAVQGLVPRARSIPAPAGEPPRPHGPADAAAVYPRACGGTSRELSLRSDPLGLSPRLRGNRVPIPVLAQLYGSIPAPAGEPPGRPPLRLRDRVYPRACGGTMLPGPNAYTSEGLSPRLRGNRHLRRRAGPASGSIPAPAGEPITEYIDAVVAEVYPRACGGTIPAWQVADMTSGLSPRLRGNHNPQDHDAPHVGSIPAPAGEP